MCLIIKKPAGRHIAADFLENAWQNNSHGWGCFYLHAGAVRWARGLVFDELVAHNQRLPYDTEVYVHLRKATYGAINCDMAHPYVVREGLLLMHNGSISHLAPKDPSISDTCELAGLLRDMLAGLTDDQSALMIRSQGFSRLIAPLIDGSLIVLFDRQGAVRLGRPWLQVQPGDWHQGMTGMEVSNTHTWSRPVRLPDAVCN
jgi:hypothetical protein